MNHPIEVAFFGECMLELYGCPLGELRQSYGGDTFNTAVYLARCGGGAIRSWYATAVGTDDLSQTLVERWAQEGLMMDLVRRIPHKLPGIYQIHVNHQGERSFSFWRNQSAAKDYFNVSVTPLEQHLEVWNAFYFSGISLAILADAGRQRLLALAQVLRARGAKVVFDNNYRSQLWTSRAAARQNFELAFAVADILMITAEDHQVLYDFDSVEEAVASVQKINVPELIIKRGAAATLVRRGDEPYISVPTESVKVVDTTAAGDSFAAGYLSRRLRGVNPREAAKFGNCLAARVIAHQGAIIAPMAMADLMT